jgi:hypothetical protein
VTAPRSHARFVATSTGATNGRDAGTVAIITRPTEPSP